MANSKENNDVQMHLSTLSTYVNCCEVRRHNNDQLLNENFRLLDALSKLKSEDTNLDQERTTLVQEYIRQEKRIIGLVQYQNKIKCIEEENKKISEENVELKEKIKKLKENTAELIKENVELNPEYSETSAKEAAKLEQDMASKLKGLVELWQNTNNGYKLEIKRYQNQEQTIRESIHKLESVEESFENRFDDKHIYYIKKLSNDKDHVKSLAVESAKYISKRGDEGTAKAVLQAVTPPFLYNDYHVKSLAEAMSKRAAEDTAKETLQSVTHPPKNVQFQRGPVINDSVDKNIDEEQQAVSNAKCSKKIKLNPAPDAYPTKPRRNVHVRQLNYRTQSRR